MGELDEMIATPGDPDTIPDGAGDPGTGDLAPVPTFSSQGLSRFSVEGLEALYARLELTLDQVKEERARRVEAAGGRLVVCEGLELRKVQCGDKHPRSDKLLPLLRKKGLKIEDGTFSQVEYHADPVKLAGLVASGKLTAEELATTKRTWTQIRRIRVNGEAVGTDE